MSDRNIKGGKSRNYITELFFGQAEKTFEESAFVEKSQYKPFNSDDLYQKAGDHSIYEDMLYDDQVSVALQLKKDLVIGTGFDIIAQDEGQEDIIDDLNRAVINDVCPSFSELLEEILSAYEFGFSLTEKIFKTREDGSLTLKTLKTRHPDTWLIYTDEHGNIEKYEQQGVDRNVKIDPRSLIHYVNNRKFQNAYGKSDLRAAYQAYFTKRHITRYYAIFLEKAASPTPVARYDKSVKDATVTKIFNIIKKFQSRTAMTLPKDVELEFLESKSNGEAYIKGINIFNMFIGRALTIPDLIGFQGSDTQGGSHALSKEQMRVFANHIKRRRDILEGVVNEHIIRPLVIFNYGDIDNPPIFRLRPIDDDTAMEFAKIFLDAVRVNAYEPNEEEINHFRSLIKFPEAEVEKKESAPAPFNPINPNPNNDDGPSISNDDEIEIEQTEEPERGKQEFKSDIIPKSDGGFKDLPGTFKDKVDFKTIGDSLESNLSDIVNRTNPLVDEMFATLMNDIQKKKILEKKNTELVDNLKLKNLKGVQVALKTAFRKQFQDSQQIASNELFNTKVFQQPILTDEFLELLEKETFDAIGDWQFKIKQQLKIELRNAIKDGRPLSSVITELEGILPEQQKVAIERFARTKATEIMNRGRLEVFDKSDLVQGYQFSAILDGRTTMICAGLHGKQFKKGTEPVPPLHFNCRSTLIPITRFEKMEPDSKVGGTVETRRAGDINVPNKDIDQHIEDNLGKGFSRN